MLHDMREGKLCPETLSLQSEYIMLQSLFLLLRHEFFQYFFHCFKDLSVHSPRVGEKNIQGGCSTQMVTY